LNNRTEWVTDANTEIKVVDFANLGTALADGINMDIQELIFGFQVPATLMGVSDIPEGQAVAQTEGFQRRCASYQDITEKVVEGSIFKPILESQGLDGDVEITWILPGEEEINARITSLTTLLSSQGLSENLRRMIELELATVLKIKDADLYLNKPDAELKKLSDEIQKTPPVDPNAEQQAKPKPKATENAEREKEETQITQPEIPGEKINSKDDEVMKLEAHVEMIEEKDVSIMEWVDLKELHGFNYSDYLVSILKRIDKDKFADLRAATEEDFKLGLLTDSETEKLRLILRNGFKKNKSIRQIESDINRFIKLRDRYIINESGVKVLKLEAANRANNIARTETVRLANTGLLDTYDDNGIKQTRFLAAVSDRTCPICEGLNGKVYELKESYGVIPVHSNCRCTWIGVV
jgi:SPP1 gp7 family putative phage head morphogenesis protein